MKDLLLEIGVEEIPARFLPDAILSLSGDCIRALDEYFIEFSRGDSPRVYATPKRLALIVKGIHPMQRAREVFGPPKKIAFNEDGTPTKAGIKFAGAVGVPLEKLTIKEKGKGQYVVAEVPGQAVKDVLPEVLKKIILSLGFPKSMRWGNGTLRFVRPIRWLVALFDDETIPFDIDGIHSSNLTRGHRFFSTKPIEIHSADSYERQLKEGYVIVNQKEREKIILDEMNTLTSSVSGTLVTDNELLETVIHLVEYPHAVMGKFDETYIKLPEELLSVVMKGHQKYFSVKDSGGRLMNRFILISNTKPENDDVVRLGAEKVIKARFEDARFYYEKDRTTPLINRVEDLKRVIYQEKLGSLHDKTMRVVNLAVFIAEKISPADVDTIRQSALLSKADLITGVVREFPELQGIMGYYYAIHNKENDLAAKAIKEQYFHEDGDIYDISQYGGILNLADKMDNIASFFSIGLKPTGSQDPFALRRQAIAVIEILSVLSRRPYNFTVTISQMLDIAISKLSHVADPQSLKKEIREFFEARIENLPQWNNPLSPYTDRLSPPPDIIGSVLHLSCDIPFKDLIERIKALNSFKSDPQYQELLTVLKRVRNIIPKEKPPKLNIGLLVAEEEKTLGSKVSDVKQNVSALIKKGDYNRAIMEISGLTTATNKFFDSVLVMDKNEEVKQNRLSLLYEIWVIAFSIADFSRLD